MRKASALALVVSVVLFLVLAFSTTDEANTGTLSSPSDSGGYSVWTMIAGAAVLVSFLVFVLSWRPSIKRKWWIFRA
jgi:hypothetical protein